VKRYRSTLAAYPKRKEDEQPPAHPKMSFVSAWLCSRWGLPGRRITADAGGLLHHHFTLTRLHKAIQAVCFCGPFRQVTPPRVLPGIALYGVRTFLDPAQSGAAITRLT